MRRHSMRLACSTLMLWPQLGNGLALATRERNNYYASFWRPKRGGRPAGRRPQCEERRETYLHLLPLRL